MFIQYGNATNSNHLNVHFLSIENLSKLATIHDSQLFNVRIIYRFHVFFYSKGITKHRQTDRRSESVREKDWVIFFIKSKSRRSLANVLFSPKQITLLMLINLKFKQYLARRMNLRHFKARGHDIYDGTLASYIFTRTIAATTATAAAAVVVVDITIIIDTFDAFIRILLCKKAGW